MNILGLISQLIGIETLRLTVMNALRVDGVLELKIYMGRNGAHG